MKILAPIFFNINNNYYFSIEEIDIPQYKTKNEDPTNKKIIVKGEVFYTKSYIPANYFLTEQKLKLINKFSTSFIDKSFADNYFYNICYYIKKNISEKRRRYKYIDSSDKSVFKVEDYLLMQEIIKSNKEAIINNYIIVDGLIMPKSSGYFLDKLNNNVLLYINLDFSDELKNMNLIIEILDRQAHFVSFNNKIKYFDVVSDIEELSTIIEEIDSNLKKIKNIFFDSDNYKKKYINSLSQEFYYKKYENLKKAIIIKNDPNIKAMFIEGSVSV